MIDNYKGFSLFNDIEDTTLRNRNRGVVMANIVEIYQKDKKISQKGFYLLMSYFSQVPDSDKKSVYEQFQTSCKERGYVCD